VVDGGKPVPVTVIEVPTFPELLLRLTVAGGEAGEGEGEEDGEGDESAMTATLELIETSASPSGIQASLVARITAALLSE
jgi:hypothetical protein